MHVEAEAGKTCGIAGTHMRVTVHGEEETACGHDHAHDHHHHHHHATPGHIGELIDTLHLPEEVKKEARAVYDRIARAEARAHGCPVGDVHFHEGGSPGRGGRCDRCMLLPVSSKARADRGFPGPCGKRHGAVRSRDHAGSGACHSQLAGGSAKLRRRDPGRTVYAYRSCASYPVRGCFWLDAGDDRRWRGDRIGTKEFPQANCVRVFLGESQESEGTGANGRITELICNLDDMTPEALSFACGRLLEAGALDVYTLPGTMKKGRPGHVLTVLCEEGKEEEIVRKIFRETATNGVRAAGVRNIF